MRLALMAAHWPVSGVVEAVNRMVQALGGPGLLLVAIADSSFLTIPEGNDLLIVVLSAGKSWGEMAYYVAMTAIGSIIGCLLLYAVGRKGGAPFLRRRFSEANLLRVERMLERYGMLSLFIPSLLPPPCPFKIFVLTAGVFKLRVSEFVAVVALGRSLRYTMWGILAVLYGERAKGFIRNNVPTLGALLFAVFLLVAVTVLMLNWRRRRARHQG